MIGCGAVDAVAEGGDDHPNGAVFLERLHRCGDFRVVIPGSRLDRAQRLGADRTLTPSESIAADVTDALDGRKPDVVIEASGAPGRWRRHSIRVVSRANGNELARYDLSEDASTGTAMVFGELYRYGAEWNFRAIGQGYASGLEGIARDFGVNL